MVYNPTEVKQLIILNLLASEKNYSAIEREALEIEKGIKHFRTYLEGSTFTVQTDHNPLIHLGNLKDSHGRLARWALSLSNHTTLQLFTGVRSEC